MIDKMPLHSYLMRRVALLLAGALLAGCGLKGPLYLPEPDEKTQPVEHNKADSRTEERGTDKQITGP